MSSPQGQLFPGSETSDCDGPDVPSVDTPSPPPSPNTISPRAASHGLRLFTWSGSCSSEQTKTHGSTSGLSVLEQFQYKNSFAHRPSGKTSPLRTSSSKGNLEDKDNLPDSPPSQDSAYISQSQSSLHLTSVDEEEVPTYSFPSSYQEDAALVRSYKSFLSL